MVANIFRSVFTIVAVTQLVQAYLYSPRKPCCPNQLRNRLEALKDMSAHDMIPVPTIATFTPLINTNPDLISTYSFPLSVPSLSVESLNSIMIIGLSSILLLFPTEAAFAKDGAYGVFEGRTASLLHPITMLLLFGTSVYSGVLGLKWRQLRGLSEEIKDLNAQLPVLSTGKVISPINVAAKTISSNLASLSGSEDNDTPARIATLNNDLALLKSAAEIDVKIINLNALRKSLQAANLKDKHQTTGSVLLGVGVSVSLLGAFNTYMRSGKLFPGPHLYAGMGITMLWAIAAALVPAMQKGNESARVGHIAANSINVILFAWQVYTGLDILVSVWGKTQWP